MSNELESVARELVAKGRGILAADESDGTIKKRFDTIGVESTEESRRAYRDLLFTTPGVEDHISGVILFEETIRQSSADGTPFPKLLASRGIHPGIKVDKGAKALPSAPGEKMTEGLDGLRGRLEEFRALGARFAKWRAVITIGDGIPSGYCLDVNAHALARYAALCVEQGLVPIVEPEVLMDGPHTIERCYEVTSRTLHRVFGALATQRVPLEQILLKPNMVISGSECATRASASPRRGASVEQQIAEMTIRCFRNHVPAAVPGVVFLSGGQSDVEATVNLNEMNKLADLPWEVSFSYGRALQASPLSAWSGEAKNVPAAQDAFRHRSLCNGKARYGEYTEEMERVLELPTDATVDL